MTHPLRLVTLKMADELIAAISRSARARGQSPQDFVRQTLQQAVRSPGEGTAAILPAAAPQAPVTAPPVTAAEAPPCPDRLQEAFATAESWLDLQCRLRAAGFVLRLTPGQPLALHDWPQNRFLIAADQLGQSLAVLTLRFHAPFPGMPPDGRTRVRRRA